MTCLLCGPGSWLALMPISKIVKYRDGEKERSLSRIHHFLSAQFISERQQEYTGYLHCLGFQLFRGTLH